jgi:Uma2 family endonuclease
MATPSRSGARLTYDDLVRLPEDGLRHEIIDGVHYVTPSPGSRHQRLIRRLLVAIDNHLETHPGTGEVFGAPLDTVFSQWDVVEPDVLLVAADQRHVLTAPNIQGAPALVVEILSPGTKARDLGIKRQLYDRGGVREYWIVDPVGNTMMVYRRAVDGSFAVVNELTVEAVLTTPLLPGFSLPLQRLFAD